MAKEKTTTRIGLIDMEDGERLDEGTLVYVPKRVRMKEGWFMAMQDGLADLAKQPLRGESMRVLLYLMSQMDYENHIRLSVSAVAEALSMKKQNASRALKELRQRGIIFDGEHASMRLDPGVGWRGNVKALRSHEREMMKQCEREAREDATTA